MKDFITVIFSRDRASQCDLLLKSINACTREYMNIHVIYTCDTDRHWRSYEKLKNRHGEANFHIETTFKYDLISLIRYYKYVLFMVDDNICVSDFSIEKIIDLLEKNKTALGFSLRLGANCTECYTLSCKQEMPPSTKIADNVFMYSWFGANADFGYPLELSSSIYKVSDIIPILMNENFLNPNELEWKMQSYNYWFSTKKPHLLLYQTSACFCNPINKININNNRSGNNPEYSIESLLTKYEKGVIIKYDFKGFIPNGCHQEVDIEFGLEKGEE